MNFTATFSIVARDPATGALGVAGASRALAVGAKIVTLQPGVAAVASQAWASQVLGQHVMEGCARGLPAADALAAALALDVADPPRGRPRGAEYRQVAVIDAHGRTALHTGREVAGAAGAYAGHRAGPEYAVAGNMLAGPRVLEAMAEAFERGADAPHFAARLFRALRAGEAAGGDRRGKQAAVLVTALAPQSHTERLRDVDLRVDDHLAPLSELERLLGLALG